MTRGTALDGDSVRRRRDNFSAATVRLVAEQVGHRCSNPGCGAPTMGPSSATGSSNVGIAAHIAAAAPGGPRFDPQMTPEERRAPTNAVWLCARCGRLIDNDTATFTVAELAQWKADAMSRAQQALVTGATVLMGPTPESIVHDKERFAKSDGKMDERDLRGLLVTLNRDSGADGWISKTHSWCHYFQLEGNQYVRPILRESCTVLRNHLLWFAEHHDLLFTKVIEKPKPLSLEPGVDGQAKQLSALWDLVKATGVLTPYSRRANVSEAQFSSVWQQLVQRAHASFDAYVVYRRAVKHSLFA